MGRMSRARRISRRKKQAYRSQAFGTQLTDTGSIRRLSERQRALFNAEYAKYIRMSWDDSRADDSIPMPPKIWAMHCWQIHNEEKAHMGLRLIAAIESYFGGAHRIRKALSEARDNGEEESADESHPDES